MRMVWCLVALGLTTTGLALADESRKDANLDVAATAWRRSLDLEGRHEIERARAILIEAFGEKSANFDVALRLGWLSLLLEDGRTAAGHYRRALVIQPDSKDATQGLELARALLERPRVNPSIWGSYARKSTSYVDWEGWGLAVTLPVEITRHLTLRAAYAHADMVVTGTLAPRPRVGDRWKGNDIFLGAGWTDTRWGVEALGIRLFNSDLRSLNGADLRLWAGGRFGGSLELALLELPAGVSRQLEPMAYAVPLPWLVLSAGPRLTMDDDGGATSLGAAAVVGRVHRLYLGGHYGPERWRVDGTLPSVASFRDPSAWGASAALLITFASWAEVGIHASVQRLSASRSEGYSTVASIGFRFLLAREREN